MPAALFLIPSEPALASGNAVGDRELVPVLVTSPPPAARSLAFWLVMRCEIGIRRAGAHARMRTCAGGASKLVHCLGWAPHEASLPVSEGVFSKEGVRGWGMCVCTRVGVECVCVRCLCAHQPRALVVVDRVTREGRFMST